MLSIRESQVFLIGLMDISLWFMVGSWRFDAFVSLPLPDLLRESFLSHSDQQRRMFY